VGDVINFGKPLDLKALKERYLGMKIILAKTEFIIEDLVGVEKGVKMKLRNKTNNKVGFAMDSKTKEDVVFSLAYCEEVILQCLKG